MKNNNLVKKLLSVVTAFVLVFAMSSCNQDLMNTTFTPDNADYDKITFNIGTLVGSVEIDDVVLTLKDSKDNLIPNGTFEGYRILRPAGSVQVTDKLVQWSRGVASEWFQVAAK